MPGTQSTDGSSSLDIASEDSGGTTDPGNLQDIAALLGGSGGGGGGDYNPYDSYASSFLPKPKKTPAIPTPPISSGDKIADERAEQLRQQLKVKGPFFPGSEAGGFYGRPSKDKPVSRYLFEEPDYEDWFR